MGNNKIDNFNNYEQRTYDFADLEHKYEGDVNVNVEYYNLINIVGGKYIGSILIIIVLAVGYFFMKVSIPMAKQKPNREYLEKYAKDNNLPDYIK